MVLLYLFSHTEYIITRIGKKAIKNSFPAGKRRNQNDTTYAFHFKFLSKKKRPPVVQASDLVIFDFNIQS